VVLLGVFEILDSYGRGTLMRLAPMAGIPVVLLLLTTACQSDPLPTPYPTYTLYPTYTPYPTHTPATSIDNLPSAHVEDVVWPTGPHDDVIQFADAADFIGDKIIVEGTIIKTHNSGNAVFLDFSPNFDSFSAVIFADDWAKFPSPPEDLFYGKLVRIEGLIEEYQGTPEIIIRDPWQIEVALTLGQPVLNDCDCPVESQPQMPAANTPVPTESTPTSEPAADEVVPDGEAIVSWQNAADYEGQPVKVKGLVVDTYNSGKVVFLNFAEDYQTTFKVVIFPDAWPLFPAPPEEFYRNKTIQVTGQVELYQGVPEIIVKQPEQIEIVE
jgi:DNA/RNA endonuclease YhcR with UshA esterase domain